MRCWQGGGGGRRGLTIAGGGRLFHDTKGDGALEGIRQLRGVLQVVGYMQWGGPMHFLTPMIVPAKNNKKHLITSLPANAERGRQGPMYLLAPMATPANKIIHVLQSVGAQT